MKTIIRVAAEYGPQIVAAMGSAAAVARSAEEIVQHAHNIANQWRSVHATVEHGHQPSTSHPQLSYFCWEWDSRFGCWRIAQWNGYTWVLL